MFCLNEKYLDQNCCAHYNSAPVHKMKSLFLQGELYLSEFALCGLESYIYLPIYLAPKEVEIFASLVTTPSFSFCHFWSASLRRRFCAM